MLRNNNNNNNSEEKKKRKKKKETMTNAIYNRCLFLALSEGGFFTLRSTKPFLLFFRNKKKKKSATAMDGDNGTENLDTSSTACGGNSATRD